MPLQAVLDRLAHVSRDRLPIVVLDLDSTLFDTARRQHRILREFAESRPEVAALVDDVPVTEMRYQVGAPLRARGVDDEALFAELAAFWLPRFFSDEYCLEDLPAPGAVAFAKRCVEQRALVYYLTGRPAEAMAGGTVESLRRHGFPILRGRAVLHMKPSAHLDDNRFKAAAMAEIGALHGDVVATADNEPAHCLAFLRAFPDATHFLYGRVRSPTAPEPHPDLVPIETFHV